MSGKNKVQSRSLFFDDSFDTITAYRVAGACESESLSWRFIHATRGTLCVRPVQIPRCENPFVMPYRIQSALRAARFLIELVHVDSGDKRLDVSKRAGRREEETLFALNHFIGKHSGKNPVAMPRVNRFGGYSNEQIKKIGRALRDEKKPGAVLLASIREFIQKECEPSGVRSSLIIRDGDLRRLVEFIGGKVGCDISLSVKLAYDGSIKDQFEKWVKEAMRSHEVSAVDAFGYINNSFRFVAECHGKKVVQYLPVEDISNGFELYDAADVGLLSMIGRLKAVE